MATKKPWKAYSYLDNPHDFSSEDTVNSDYNPPDEYRAKVCEFMDQYLYQVDMVKLIRAGQAYYNKFIRSKHLDLQHWCLQKISDSYFLARKTVTVFVDKV